MVQGLSPLIALVVLYIVTMVLTELLSNATVAVLVTPIAVALANSLGVSPRPFLVAVMMAASAAFATPFGYQTNVIVYQMAWYRYMDFVRIGLPLNLITAARGRSGNHVIFPLLITVSPSHMFNFSSTLGQPFSSSSRVRAPTCLL